MHAPALRGAHRLNLHAHRTASTPAAGEIYPHRPPLTPAPAEKSAHRLENARTGSKNCAHRLSKQSGLTEFVTRVQDFVIRV
jgi:hypothetical protein